MFWNYNYNICYSKLKLVCLGNFQIGPFRTGFNPTNIGVGWNFQMRDWSARYQASKQDQPAIWNNSRSRHRGHSFPAFSELTFNFPYWRIKIFKLIGNVSNFICNLGPKTNHNSMRQIVLELFYNGWLTGSRKDSLICSHGPSTGSVRNTGGKLVFARVFLKTRSLS